MEENKIVSLSDLKKDMSARVVNVQNQNKALRRRFLDMGITQGVIVKIKKIAPLGDPISVELRGYELCIRKSDMKNIDVEVVEWKLL